MPLNENTFTLTMEQSLHLRVVEVALPELSREELENIIMQLTTQLAAKDNVIRQLVKDNLNGTGGLC